MGAREKICVNASFNKKLSKVSNKKKQPLRPVKYVFHIKSVHVRNVLFVLLSTEDNVMFASNLFWELSSSENIYCMSTYLSRLPTITQPTTVLSSLSQLRYCHLFAKFEHCLIQFLHWCAPGAGLIW